MPACWQSELRQHGHHEVRGRPGAAAQPRHQRRPIRHRERVLRAHRGHAVPTLPEPGHHQLHRRPGAQRRQRQEAQAPRRLPSRRAHVAGAPVHGRGDRDRHRIHTSAQGHPLQLPALQGRTHWWLPGEPRVPVAHRRRLPRCRGGFPGVHLHRKPPRRCKPCGGPEARAPLRPGGACRDLRQRRRGRCLPHQRAGRGAGPPDAEGKPCRGCGMAAAQRQDSDRFRVERGAYDEHLRGLPPGKEASLVCSSMLCLLQIMATV
mmetsp:Transcript_90768/g.252506  ORF Transcript_90768/g.252506 Transcript_90768/m.252506 type:complete len:262 (-) Transcript_90768:8-793(-)